jgi:hypothetical protein
MSGRAVLCRQGGQFLVQNLAQVANRVGGLGGRFRSVRDGPLPVTPSQGLRPDLGGDPPGDRVQPVRQRTPLGQRLRPADEHKKGGLERVFGVGHSAEDPPTDAQD